MVWSARATCTWKQGRDRLRSGYSGKAAFLPEHYFILWWFYDGLREEYPGKEEWSGCAPLAQVTDASEVQHLLPFEGSAISPVIEHHRLWFFECCPCHWNLGCCVAHFGASYLGFFFKCRNRNIQENVAHLWINSKLSFLKGLRVHKYMRKPSQPTFWWMSPSLLFYSVVANITDPVSWKEFALPLRCEMHIDYGAPRVSCPWQGWYWLKPALAVKYGWILPICLHLNYLYNG